MMRILFCNIAWMKEYRGNEDGKDTPLNGGSYVDETGDAHEKYNFTPVNMEGKEGLYCLGFFETKSHNGKKPNSFIYLIASSTEWMQSGLSHFMPCIIHSPDSFPIICVPHYLAYLSIQFSPSYSSICFTNLVR